MVEHAELSICNMEGDTSAAEALQWGWGGVCWQATSSQHQGLLVGIRAERSIMESDQPANEMILTVSTGDPAGALVTRQRPLGKPCGQKPWQDSFSWQGLLPGLRTARKQGACALDSSDASVLHSAPCT